MKSQHQPYLDNFIFYLVNNKGKNILTDTRRIASYLDPLGDQNKYQVNLHWNDFGSIILSSVRSDNLVLHINSCPTYLVKPKLLETFYFLRRPNLSFLRMEYQGLEPTGVNDYEKNNVPRSENCVFYQGKFHPSSCWETGQTEEGYLLGLEAELQVRELKDGAFMIVPKGNLLNTSDFNAHRNDIVNFGRNSLVLQELIKRFA